MPERTPEEIEEAWGWIKKIDEQITENDLLVHVSDAEFAKRPACVDLIEAMTDKLYEEREKLMKMVV